MYKICFLLFVVFIIAVCIKMLRGRNKKAAPVNPKISEKKTKDDNLIFSQEINKIRCKEIIKK